MLAKRLIVGFALLPVGLLIVALGGSLFYISVILVLAIAAWEYVQLFQTGGYQTAGVLVVASTVVLAASRVLAGFANSDLLLAIITLSAMAYSLLSFEQNRDNKPGTNFGIALGGILYLGWIGSYLISLRDLPEGEWWFFITLLSVVAEDSAAYIAGHRFGRRKISPRVSPNKTLEGYIGGVIAATIAGMLLAVIFTYIDPSAGSLSLLRGALLGLILGIFTPLGDLGESMFKREVGAKDSGTLLPGHGGIFDRIDSWLWAGVIGYYIVTTFFIH